MKRKPLQTDLSMFLDPSQRYAEPQRGQIGHARMAVKSIDEQARQIHFVCSTAEVDRYGEVVLPTAYAASLPAFMRNPVFQAGHVYVGTSGEPTTIGHWVKVWVSPEGLEGIAQFDDEDPLAVRYWNLYRKGHMKAVSVGFIANTWEMRELDPAVPGKRTRVFTEVELIEVSAVAIPANPAALMRAAAAFGSSPALLLDSAGAANAGSGALNVEQLAQALEPLLERSLARLLDAGPGGRLCTLIQDVAEAVHGCGGFGDPDECDIHDHAHAPERESSSNGADPELKALLDQLARQAGGDPSAN